MSYRNPKIIVDNSGSMVSNAIASGVKEMAAAFAKRKIRADKAGQIETNRLNKQSQDRVDNAAENAKNSEGLGQGVQKQGAQISNALMENKVELQTELDAGNVPNDRRLAIENQLIKINSIQDNLDSYYVSFASSKEFGETLELDTGQFAEGRTAWNNGKNGRPNVAMGFSAATSGLENSNLTMELKDDPTTGWPTNINVAGSGGGEDFSTKWDFNGPITEANEILNNPIHKITQLNDEARTFLNATLYSDKKNTLITGFIDEGTKAEQTTEAIAQTSEDGIERPQYYLKTKHKMNSKANAAYEEMGYAGLATFTTASVQDKRSMLINLGYEPKDVIRLMNDMADTNEDTGVEKSREAEEEIKKEIIETELATSSNKMIVRENTGTDERPEYIYYQETTEKRDMTKEQLVAFDRLKKVGVTKG